MTPKHFSNRFCFYTIYLRKITQKNLKEKKTNFWSPPCPQVCRNTKPNIGRNRRNRETHVQKNIQIVFYTIKKRGHIVNPMETTDSPEKQIVGANGIPRVCMNFPQGPPLHLLRQSWGPNRLLLDVSRQSRWILNSLTAKSVLAGEKLVATYPIST
jgi:hypothetical protein